MSSRVDRPEVAVCVCTAGRSTQLSRLLGRVAGQSWFVAGRTLGLVVIDNNPRPEVGRQVATWGEQAQVQTVYRHLAVRNLSMVRNEALSAAGALAPFAALVDDDELPEPDWLQGLFRTQQATGAPVVVGPVRPIFPPGTPEWLERCGVFDLHEQPEGARLTEGITGNALMDLRVLQARGLTFDERLGRSGGEDQVFFRRLNAAGVEIRYSAGALIYEPVAPDRLNLQWIIERELRKGNTLGWLARNQPDLGESAWYRAAAAAKWLALGVLGLVGSPLERHPRTEAARSLLRTSRAVGMLSGLLGWTPTTYE